MSYDESRPPPARPGPISQRPVPPSPRRLRASREARVRHIRRRVTGLTAAVFLLLWGVIFARLVEGHDPALSRTAASRAGSTTAVAHVSAGAARSLRAERAAARRQSAEARAQARDRAQARAQRRARAAARAAAQAANATAAVPAPAPPPVQAAPAAPTYQAPAPAPAPVPAPATTRRS